MTISVISYIVKEVSFFSCISVLTLLYFLLSILLFYKWHLTVFTFVGGAVAKRAGALDSSPPQDGLLPSVGKKMATLHFSTIPCEPWRAHKIQDHTRKAIVFAIFLPVLTTSCSLGLKMHVLHVFMSALGITGKYTSFHLFYYGGFELNLQ